jgi:positive regulator of sigma E activity
MKNKKSILVCTTMIMLPLVIFSFVQFIKSIQTGQAIFGAIALLCSIGSWFLVIMTFRPKKKQHSSNIAVHVAYIKSLLS